MLAFDITPATVIIGLVVVALAVLAVRRLVKRGTCDCHDHGGGDGGASPCAGGCAGCHDCGAAERMAAEVERAAAKQASV